VTEVVKTGQNYSSPLGRCGGFLNGQFPSMLRNTSGSKRPHEAGKPTTTFFRTVRGTNSWRPMKKVRGQKPRPREAFLWTRNRLGRSARIGTIQGPPFGPLCARKRWGRSFHSLISPVCPFLKNKRLFPPLRWELVSACSERAFKEIFGLITLVSEICPGLPSKNRKF